LLQIYEFCGALPECRLLFSRQRWPYIKNNNASAKLFQKEEKASELLHARLSNNFFEFKHSLQLNICLISPDHNKSQLCLINHHKLLEMKKLLYLIFVVMIAAACGNSSQNQTSTAPDVEPDNLTEISLDVKGMTCSGCENSVKRSLGDQAGVYAAEASHESELVVVRFDPAAIGIDQITEAITRVGYKVVGENVEESEPALE
jgi:copper chaperone CopZ